jgi:regulator of replication initiation timing
MGVLVALLVVAVRVADQSARAESAEVRGEKSEAIKQVDYAIEDAEFRIDGLKDFRPDLLDRLQLARKARAHLQDSLQDLEDEAKQLARQLSQFSEKPDAAPETLVQLDQEEAQLKHRILAAKEQLEQLEEQKPTEHVVYSIVPTDASGTTNRRPIYIECFQNRLVIQPHGIEFLASDFAPPIQVGNPLDAAMIAIRNYWDKHQLAGNEGDAYPLLIVRPSGAKSYALARYAIQSWDDEFGYELVTENLPLDFGIRDEQLEQEIRLAIAEAKKRQQLRASALAVSSRYQQGGGGQEAGGRQYTGLTVDHEQGGFKSNGSSGRSGVESNSDGEINQFNSEYANSQSRNGSQSDSASRKQLDGDSAAPEDANQQISGSFGTQGGAAAGNSLEPISQSQGKNWALPSRTEGGTVYRRPITITCSANQLVVASGSSLDDRAQTVIMNGATSEAIEPLVNEVWKKIESWGFAGSGGYWKPELRIRVQPGGQQRARDLATLLNGSGLDLIFSEQR